MNSLSDSVDVCISGGGIAGLVLALGLAPTGCRVLVAERNATINLNGADVLKPAGIAVLEQLGLLPALLAAEAQRREQVEIYHNGTLLEVMDYRRDNNARPYFYLVPYQVVVRTVLEALRAFSNVEIRFNTALTGLRYSASAPATLEAVVLNEQHVVPVAVVVGADGVNSTLRNLLGVTARPHFYEQMMFYQQRPMVASVREINRLYVDEDFGLAYFYPINRTQFRAVVGLLSSEGQALCQGQDAQALEQRLRRFVSASPDVLPALGPLHEFNTFPLCRLHLEAYVHGNAVLLGNAAHAIHPIAGQGMNLAIEDAGELAHQLTLFFAGTQSVAAALQAYQEQRHFINDKIVRYADQLATSLADVAKFAGCLNLTIQTSGRQPQHLEMV
ncbi:FAD-dependent monooxygenase [Hymenobacter rubripertinctus]|uniref:Monooxygenase n=1 Tax=Hymenobacter rubripertinctus TaxID=2029981 RepID=A0A418QWN0_9BACT|nr:FAD-dependent monooxygenase [Hymenobacter rubripertinctus]RIY09573.1 monooxygenase [Hymenobacter rubripertinctus]